MTHKHNHAAQITIINAQARSDHDERRYILSFGSYGNTHLMVYARNLEDALEECADYCADHLPGFIMLHGNGNDKRDPQLDELMAEACAEQTPPLAWPIPEDILRYGGNVEWQPYWDAEQDAFADLTYTERGYLTSDEWTISVDDGTHDDVVTFIADRANRHYSDADPVVDVAGVQHPRQTPPGRLAKCTSTHRSQIELCAAVMAR
jgi:hypothetical protein